MAGRGGGRGRGGVGGGGYFNALKDNLNIAKSEKLISSLAPPPLFPTLQFKPVPLRGGDDEDYVQGLKQALRHSFRDSEYFVAPVTIKDNAPTYSDTCQSSKAANDSQQWVPDWTSLPKELHKFQQPKKRSVKRASKFFPKKVKRNALAAKVDVEKTLQELEKKESKDEDVVDEEKANKDESQSDEEENEEGEFMDEDDIEEGTDYNMSYFDNGEDYLDDEDDNLDDGPVY